MPNIIKIDDSDFGMFLVSVCSHIILLYVASYNTKCVRSLSANYKKCKSELLAKIKYESPQRGQLSTKD